MITNIGEFNIVVLCFGFIIGISTIFSIAGVLGILLEELIKLLGSFLLALVVLMLILLWLLVPGFGFVL